MEHANKYIKNKKAAHTQQADREHYSWFCKGQTHPSEKGCNNEGGEGVIICKMLVLA